ncbi:MAG: SDR family NAD(P)-dependent oxidoreductase [Bacteroidales bacterium]|nr:SDR family NAD(P)-dependent oxidoreductase [Bacteroidales bacterium]
MKKSILITGASGGFGEAIAKNMGKYDYNLILTGRNEANLKKVCDEIKKEHPQCQILPLVFDVQDPDACKKAIESIPAEFSYIDILVNNAGLAVELNPIHKGALEDWERMINTNIKGVLYITRLVSPQMVERKEGHIINIGSIASHEIYPGGNVYCASKHALFALTKGMRADFLPYNIRVTQVSPGAAETNFSVVRFHGDKAKADKVYEGYTPLVAQDIADIVEFAITRPAHVCLNEIVVTPTAQFNGVINRK